MATHHRKGFNVESLLNTRFVTAILTAIAAALVSTGILPKEISDAHIAQAATLLMALAAIYAHGKAAGAASGAHTVTTSVTDAAIAATEHAVGEIVTSALVALEKATQAPAPAPAPKPAVAPAPAPAAVVTPVPMTEAEPVA